MMNFRWPNGEGLEQESLRRGPHPPGTSRERCRNQWKLLNQPRTRQPQNGAGCPLSWVVGSWFLPEPGPEPPSALLSHRSHNPKFQGGPWMRAMKTVAAGSSPQCERATVCYLWRVLLELDFCDCCSGGGGGLG
jgi:hypothetical protein